MQNTLSTCFLTRPSSEKSISPVDSVLFVFLSVLLIGIIINPILLSVLILLIGILLLIGLILLG